MIKSGSWLFCVTIVVSECNMARSILIAGVWLAVSGKRKLNQLEKCLSQICTNGTE